MTARSVMKFDPSLRSFPTVRAALRTALAVCTLGRSGVADHTEKVVDRSALPENLRSLVLRTVHETRLWTSERAEVARELASHFRAGLDSGQPADALAGSFGDPHTAAALIRRAAQRKRPLPWRAWVAAWKAVGGLTLALLVMYALFAARYFIGSPSINRNYFNEYNDAVRATPLTDRAWPDYRRALMEMPDWPNQDISDTWPAVTPDDPQYVVARAYINAAQPQLDLIRQASRKPALGYEWLRSLDVDMDVRMAERRGLRGRDLEPVRESARLTNLGENPDMMGVLLPYLGHMRAIARDLMFDAAVARRDADAPRLASDIEAMLGIAHQTGEDKTLISQLVGYAVLNVATNEVRRTLTASPSLLTDEQLTRIAHRMATCIRPGSLTPELSGERLFMDDFLQRAYTDDGHGDGRLTNEGMDYLMQLSGYSGSSLGHPPTREGEITRHAVGPVYSQLIAGRKDMKAEYQRLLQAAAERGSRPYWQQMADKEKSEIERLSDDTTWSGRYLPIKLLVPAINKTFWAAQSQSLQRDAAGLAIACELYRRRNGAWPATLADIPPSLAPAIPTDPFTGRPVLYRVTDGTPRIYSTGNDQDDDGGTVIEMNRGRTSTPDPVIDGDWPLWPLDE
ncbi:MAG: hypothetical protein U0637_10045 [Phycisphaerales bacterium]